MTVTPGMSQICWSRVREKETEPHHLVEKHLTDRLYADGHVAGARYVIDAAATASSLDRVRRKNVSRQNGFWQRGVAPPKNAEWAMNAAKLNLNLQFLFLIFCFFPISDTT